MSITIEAIYESGVLKPLSPLPNLREHEKVLITVEARSRRERQELATAEAEDTIDRLLVDLIEIDPAVAREIIEVPILVC